MAVLGYFGFDQIGEHIGSNAVAVWKNPKATAEKYTKDSTRVFNLLDVLDKRVDILEYDVKDNTQKINYGIAVDNNQTDVIFQELDPVWWYGYRSSQANRGNLWNKHNGKYGYRVPLSIQKDWHDTLLYIIPVMTTNKIPLKR